METLKELFLERTKLIAIRRQCDKDAPLSTEEGMQYAKCLLKLVLNRIKIEEIQKKEAASKRSDQQVNMLKQS